MVSVDVYNHGTQLCQQRNNWDEDSPGQKCHCDPLQLDFCPARCLSAIALSFCSPRHGSMGGWCVCLLRGEDGAQGGRERTLRTLARSTRPGFPGSIVRVGLPLRLVGRLEGVELGALVGWFCLKREGSESLLVNGGRGIMGYVDLPGSAACTALPSSGYA